MYENWLFFLAFLLPPKKEGKEKEIKLAKLVFNKFFRDQ